MKALFVTAVAAAALLLGACSTTSPDVIRPGDAQRLSTVQDAVVLNVRPVVVEGQQQGIGGTSGAVVGGIAGSSVGGRREGMVIGVLGAVAGAGRVGRDPAAVAQRRAPGAGAGQRQRELCAR
jgi:outer membrane lipoprotein SlyB